MVHTPHYAHVVVVLTIDNQYVVTRYAAERVLPVMMMTPNASRLDVV